MTYDDCDWICLLLICETSPELEHLTRLNTYYSYSFVNVDRRIATIHLHVVIIYEKVPFESMFWKIPSFSYSWQMQSLLLTITFPNQTVCVHLRHNPQVHHTHHCCFLAFPKNRWTYESMHLWHHLQCVYMRACSCYRANSTDSTGRKQ